jgi:hypothetical protein
MNRYLRKLKRKLVSKWTRRAYLERIELLAKDVVAASMGGIDLLGIDVYPAMRKLSHELRYTHYKGDGCIDHE